eukprot:CAMPEP_0180512772 /NCGR_PEP_ID=MMETSP1036_2-20121128/51777_1 /TAXON_ID=632150 /ORGANISM="Azadinium spinosum, Strain 3D9" /LENGTH=64 /DNA_ID=CAMNT_0022523955 /DNA_START=319 /DNA_END=510 /DNA_ORIENTATION=-
MARLTSRLDLLKSTFIKRTCSFFRHTGARSKPLLRVGGAEDVRATGHPTFFYATGARPSKVRDE